MPTLAHVAGIPLEEALPLVSGAGAAWAALRVLAWRARRRLRRE